MFIKLIILANLFFLSSFAKEYKAVDNLNIEMYTGKWYEVYEDNFDKLFQHRGKCATADYHLLENGNVSVYNEQLDLNGSIDSISGVAYYDDGDCGGYLTVQLDSMLPAPYWVLELGPVINNEYQYSIVSDNLGLSLFVLSRNVTDFFINYDKNVVESIYEFGFTNNINKPLIMDQTDC